MESGIQNRISLQPLMKSESMDVESGLKDSLGLVVPFG